MQIIEAWNSNMGNKDEYDHITQEGKVLWENDIIEELNTFTESDLLSTSELNYKEIVKYSKKVYKFISDKINEKKFDNGDHVAYTKSVIEFTDQLEKIELEYFYSYETISIPINGDEISKEINQLFSIMDHYVFSDEDSINSLINTYLVDVPKLNDGQNDLIDMMVKIRTELQSNDYEFKSKEVLLLIDEPGIFMHPEWLRQMIYQLVEFLENLI